MAQRVQVVLLDDIDGGDADETVQFGLDGTTYEIDLSSKNAAKLRDAFAGYVGAARKAGRSTGRRRASGGGSSRARAGEIRTWAKEQGIKVSERGRVSAEVVAQYEAAH